MKRLTPFVVLSAGMALPGALVILVLALGYYSWGAILGAALIGAVLAWPASRLVAKRIKRQDPEWDARRDRPQTPPPDEAPEKI